MLKEKRLQIWLKTCSMISVDQSTYYQKQEIASSPFGEHQGPVDKMTMVDKYRQVETEIEDFLKNCQMNTYDAILIPHWTLDSFLLFLTFKIPRTSL